MDLSPLNPTANMPGIWRTSAVCFSVCSKCHKANALQTPGSSISPPGRFEHSTAAPRPSNMENALACPPLPKPSATPVSQLLDKDLLLNLLPAMLHEERHDLEVASASSRGQCGREGPFPRRRGKTPPTAPPATPLQRVRGAVGLQRSWCHFPRGR